jgi:hypothetical protein
MQWSDVQFDPPRTTLRQFAGLWLVVWGGLALWQAFARGRGELGLALGALALTIGLLGLARPQWVRFVYVGWMVLAFPIGWAVSQIVLAVIFFGLFAPISLVFQLIGRDALHRVRRQQLESYWVPKPAPADLRRYFKQF